MNVYGLGSMSGRTPLVWARELAARRPPWLGARGLLCRSPLRFLLSCHCQSPGGQPCSTLSFLFCDVPCPDRGETIFSLVEILVCEVLCASCGEALVSQVALTVFHVPLPTIGEAFASYVVLFIFDVPCPRDGEAPVTSVALEARTRTRKPLVRSIALRRRGRQVSLLEGTGCYYW